MRVRIVHPVCVCACVCVCVCVCVCSCACVCVCVVGLKYDLRDNRAIDKHKDAVVIISSSMRVQIVQPECGGNLTNNAWGTLLSVYCTWVICG